MQGDGTLPFWHTCGATGTTACGWFCTPLAALSLPRVVTDIQLNFIDRKGLHVQAMALDCHTILGPYVPVASVDTLRRLLAYLGATPEQIEDFNQSYRSCGQGTARVTLQPGRKNLLHLHAR
jgi:hypothetical protein